MAKSILKKGFIGRWAFLIGVILAVVTGIIDGLFPQVGVMSSSVIIFILVILGLIVGLLNVTKEEAMPFLMSGAVLIIASSLGQNAGISSVQVLKSILDALLYIFVPATIIVAIKNVFTLANN